METIGIEREVRPAVDDSRPWVQSIGLLWRRRQTLMRAALLGAVVSLVIALIVPAKFKATVRLMPPDSGANGLNMLGALSALSGGNGLTAVAGDLLGGKSTGGLLVGVVRSRTVQDRLVDRFDLQKVYGARYRDKAAEKLNEATGVMEDKKSGIITIDVTDTDRKRSAEIAKAYVEELDRVIATTSTSSARRERHFLEARLETVRKELSDDAQKLSEFSKRTGVLDVRDQGRATVEAAASLQGRIIAAESQLSGLRQIYADTDFRVRSAQANIDELRRQLAKVTGRVGNLEEFPSLREIPGLAVTYADLYRRVRVQEAVFETLTKQYEIAKVEEAREIPSVTVLDTPVAPERRYGPSRALITICGTVLSLFIAVTVILIMGRMESLPADSPGTLLFRQITGHIGRSKAWSFVRAASRPVARFLQGRS